MLGQYAILRAAPGLGTAEPFNPRGLGMARSRGAGLGTAAATEAPAKIEKAELNSSEVQDVTRDPAVRGLARIMPTALIRPFDVPSQAAATTA